MTGQDLSGPDSGHNGRRLESWKEIAAYLGRDVRTVQRWERAENLPVHRLQHSKLGSVYAYAAELDAWRAGREPAAAADAAAGASDPKLTSGGVFSRPGVRVRVAAAVGAVGVALVAAMLWDRSDESHGSPAAAAVRVRSLAVLPLEDFSDSPEQSYFADGMTEALIGRLSAIRDLRVVSRTSVMQFRNTTKPMPEIAQTLNVDAVVEGSVVRDGSRIPTSTCGQEPTTGTCATS
jgi:hypothetical protein